MKTSAKATQTTSNVGSSTSGRVLAGVVVKRSGDKTVSVEVTRVLVHPMYMKRQKRTKRYLVHDEKNEAQVGQQVKIREARPLSARKRWTLVSEKIKTKDVK